jgi:hypothetical protein
MFFRGKKNGKILKSKEYLFFTGPLVQQISAKTCLLQGFTFYIVCTNYCSVFVPGRSREVQKLKRWVCTAP